LPAFVGGFITLLAVIAAWIFFRASDFAGAVSILEGMAGLHGKGDTITGVTKGTGIITALVFLLAILILPNSQQIMRRFGPVIGKVEAPASPAKYLVWSPSGLTAALSALAIIFVVLLSWGTTEFLYFQF
jgi:hypothetical protein